MLVDLLVYFIYMTHLLFKCYLMDLKVSFMRKLLSDMGRRSGLDRKYVKRCGYVVFHFG